MATSISVNGTLRNDQTSGLQDNDLAISGDLTGLSSDFRAFLLALGGDLALTPAQKVFADAAEAAGTGPSYVTVGTNGASITDLFFSDPNGDAFDGDQVMYSGSALKTVDGANIYFHSYADGNIVLATTSATAGAGDVVAAFYLKESADHLSAGIEMVTFIAIDHPDATNPDDPIDWTDLLNVSATGSLSFEFDTLKSGKFLWVAVGDDEHGLLVSGKNLNIDSDGERVSGGPNPSDAVNTSQGGAGATMGIDNQMWTPGDVGVFTLVEGFNLLGDGPDATGDDADQIDYSAYTNVSGAGLFISQKQGNTKLDLDITVFEAGGGTTPEEGRDYIGTEPSGAFIDDAPVNVKTVKIMNGTQVIGEWSISPSGTQLASGATVGGVTVTINDNNIDVNGVDALYTISWTCVDGETFNRFHVESELGKFDIGRVDIAEGITTTTPVGDTMFVDDDGPSVTLDLAPGAEVRVDESLGANAGEDESSSLGSVKVAGAVLFSTSANFGADGEGTDGTVYSLDLSSEGADSGLDDTLSGQNVLLYTDGDDIVGKTATSQIEVLRISIDSDDGDVTVTQYRAMEHGNATDHDEADTPLSIGAGLVAAIRTVTDRDGDSDDDPADIGPAIKFEDDGPSVDLTLNGTAELRLDETDNDADDNDVGGILASNSLTAAAYLTLNSASFGSDGAAGASPTVWSLAVTGANVDGVDCGLDDAVTNANILLFVVDSTTVVGKSGSAAGPVVFTVSIDATSGELSVVQNRAIEHNDPLDHDEAGVSSAVMNSGLIAAVRTVTDGDGDSDNVDVSQVIKLEDDGPSVNLTLDPTAELRLDETDNDADDNDVGGILASNSLTAAAYLTLNSASFGSDGAAGASPTVWSLAVTGANVNGLDCGLDDAVSNANILLFVVDSTTVVGKAGSAAGPVVFTVSIDATSGALSVVQNRAIEHNDPLDHDEAGVSSAVMNSGLIAAVRTVTDGDGDSASDNVDVSQVIKLEDDGPSVSLDLAPGAEIRIDESLGANAGEDESSSLGSRKVAGVALFSTSASFGSDGEGTDASVYSLDLSSEGADSGLDDTLSGENVLLYTDGDDIVGKTATGQVEVLRISIDSDDGDVTVTQYRSMEHGDPTDPDEADTPLSIGAGLVAAVRTITDGDGDSDDDPADIGPAIKFEDDGPSISATIIGAPSPTVDESNLAGDDSDSFAAQFSPSFGTDGQAATPVTYALSTPGGNSGLVDTASGQNIVLSLNGSGQIEGRTATSNALCFVVSVDASGNVSLDQQRAVVHTPDSGPDQSTTLASAGLVVLTATAHDKDGDSASAPLDIGTQLIFEDDAPSIGPIDDGLVDFALNSSVTNSLNGAVGADPNSSPYILTAFTTSITVNGVELKGVLANDSKSVSYFADSNADTIFGNSGDTKFYELSLNQTANAGAGSYTFTVLVSPPPALTEFDFSDLPSGQNLFGCIAADKTDLDGLALFVISKNADIENPGDGEMTNTSGTVNTSKGGGPVTIGDSNQMYDPGEGAYFVYMVDADVPMIAGVTGGLNQNSADDADTIGFKDTREARSASVEIVQVQGGTPATLDIKCFDIDMAPFGTNGVDTDAEARGFAEDPIATDDLVNITGVRVRDVNGNILESWADTDLDGVYELQDIPGLDNHAQVGVQFMETSPGSGIYTARVSGVNAGYTIEFDTETEHDVTLVEGVAGKFDIGGFNITERADTPDQLLEFTARVTDGDADTDSASWSIGIDGTGIHDDGAVGGVSSLSTSTMMSSSAESMESTKLSVSPDREKVAVTAELGPDKSSLMQPTQRDSLGWTLPQRDDDQQHLDMLAF